MSKILVFYDSFEKLYSMQLSLTSKQLKKVEDVLKPLGFTFRTPRR